MGQFKNALSSKRGVGSLRTPKHKLEDTLGNVTDNEAASFMAGFPIAGVINSGLNGLAGYIGPADFNKYIDSGRTLPRPGDITYHTKYRIDPTVSAHEGLHAGNLAPAALAWDQDDADMIYKTNKSIGDTYVEVEGDIPKKGIYASIIPEDKVLPIRNKWGHFDESTPYPENYADYMDAQGAYYSIKHKTDHQQDDVLRILKNRLAANGAFTLEELLKKEKSYGELPSNVKGGKSYTPWEEFLDNKEIERVLREINRDDKKQPFKKALSPK